MLAVALIIVALAIVTALFCSFAVFLQEAFSNGEPTARHDHPSTYCERTVTRFPSAVGTLQPTIGATYSI